MLPQESPPSVVYYDETVIFYHWLMYSRQVPYPTNEGLWIQACSFGLWTVLTSFLTPEEFARWEVYRSSAKRQLGERFLDDPECKEKGVARQATDDVILANRRHWQV